MGRSRSSPVGAGRRRRAASNGWRAWLGAFCAFAIAFQCIIIQGHLHVGATADAQSVAASDTAAPEVASETQKKDRAPASDRGCFICQQAQLAGAAVLPETPALPPILAAADTHLRAAVIAAVDTSASHHWRSRAPPISL